MRFGIRALSVRIRQKQGLRSIIIRFRGRGTFGRAFPQAFQIRSDDWACSANPILARSVFLLAETALGRVELTACLSFFFTRR